MRVKGSIAAFGAVGLLMAACGWVAPASAQSLESSLPLSVSTDFNIWGAGYYDGHAYFGAYTFTGGGAVYKVSTGNSNGPSPSTPMVEINRLTFSSGIYDGVVDSRNGLGYWLTSDDPIKLFKTSANAGNALMTKVGAGEMTFGAGDSGGSIALDEVNNMLYVGASNAIYKLAAGDSTTLPTLLQTLPLTSSIDGSDFYGITVDGQNGYGKLNPTGYAGSSGSPFSVVMFSLGSGTGPMTRIGRVDLASDIYGLRLNPVTGALYAGFPDSGNVLSAGGQMYTTSASGALPVSQGGIVFGQGDGIYNNQAFTFSSDCNMLYASTASPPGYVNIFDMGDGKGPPTYIDAVLLSGSQYGQAGTADQYGYTYYTTDSPATVYKISNPTCTEPPPPPPSAGGPFGIVGSKSPSKRPARPGKKFKVTFALTRWSAGYVDVAGRKDTAKVWENYDVAITMPDAGATLKGKPRVSPRIPRRKGADVYNNALISWTNVPMRVEPGTKKNYTRKFTFAVKVDKTFVGANLTFAAAATGPQQGWLRATTLTVPVTRK